MRSERWFGLAGAATAALLAGGWFGSRPPMPVRVGCREIGEGVPVGYQVAVFPAFGALAAQGLLDAMAGRGGGRLALLAVTSAAAAARLTGLSPVSGHALFLAAALGHELGHDDPAPYVVPLAAGALAITVAHKLRWGDVVGCVTASVAGAIVGAATLRRT
jgi:hypothetical protein